jgi:hypothetical protein
MRLVHVSIIVAAVTLLPALSAFGGISKIFAHGDSFAPGDTIPVFVDTSTRNSIRVQGQFMDLCTGVESSDSSFVVNIGDRIRGANSAVEILVAAGNATDLDDSTITIKFLSGEETFRIKAHKINITRMAIMERGTAPTCQPGETISLRIDGVGMDHMALGPIARMTEIAGAAEGGSVFDVGTYSGSTTSARVLITCKKSGTFTILRDWFWDPRLSQLTNSPMKMVRGSAPTRITVTVTAPPSGPIVKKPVG